MDTSTDTASQDREREKDAEIERLKAENAALAADQCHHGYGGEYGHHRCQYQDRLATLTKALEELTTACEADCTSAATETGPAPCADDESVSDSMNGPSRLTFGMIRQGRAALSPQPPSSKGETA